MRDAGLVCRSTAGLRTWGWAHARASQVERDTFGRTMDAVCRAAQAPAPRARGGARDERAEAGGSGARRGRTRSSNTKQEHRCAGCACGLRRGVGHIEHKSAFIF